MEFKIKKYDSITNKCVKYLEYIDNKGETYNNASYFIIDTLSDTFKKIIDTTGGFYRRVVIDKPEENGVGDHVSQILFACVPQRTNQFKFMIYYLDSNHTILFHMHSTSFFDFRCFRDRFSNAIIKSGFIYELAHEPFYAMLEEDFVYDPSADFGISLDGRSVHYNDILLMTNLEHTGLMSIETLSKEIGCKTMLLRFADDPRIGICLEACFLTDNNVPASEFDIDYTGDPQEHINKKYSERKNLMTTNMGFNETQIKHALRSDINHDFGPYWIRAISVDQLRCWANNGWIKLIDESQLSEIMQRSKDYCETLYYKCLCRTTYFAEQLKVNMEDKE